jgi:hypothetical protein
VDGTSSLGHVVQSLGVPLTEVGRLLVNGEPALPGQRPGGGDVVNVDPVRRPQHLMPEDLVVSLARLMEQAADLLQCACHLVPPRVEDGGAIWLPRAGRCRRHQSHHGRSADAAAST